MKRKKGNADRLTAGAWWSRNRWSCVILAATLVLFIVVRMAAVTFEQPQPRGDEYAEYETGVVTDILSDSTEADTVADGGYRGEQLLLAQVRSGQYKGETMQVYNYVGPLYGQPLKVGQRAVLLISTYSDGSHTATVYEYDRAVGLAVIVGLFLLATVLVGGKVGAKSLVALAVTLVCLFWILIPLLMKGAPTLLTVFLVCAYITVVTMVILGGVCRKTVCAALGTVAGTALALLFGLLSQSLLRIDGLRLTDGEPSPAAYRGAAAAAAADGYASGPAGPAGGGGSHQCAGRRDGRGHEHLLCADGGTYRGPGPGRPGTVPLRYEYRPGYGGYHDQHPDPGIFGQRPVLHHLSVFAGTGSPAAHQLPLYGHGGHQRHRQQHRRHSGGPPDGAHHLVHFGEG